METSSRGIAAPDRLVSACAHGGGGEGHALPEESVFERSQHSQQGKKMKKMEIFVESIREVDLFCNFLVLEKNKNTRCLGTEPNNLAALDIQGGNTDVE